VDVYGRLVALQARRRSPLALSPLPLPRASQWYAVAGVGGDVPTPPAYSRVLVASVTGSFSPRTSGFTLPLLHHIRAHAFYVRAALRCARGAPRFLLPHLRSTQRRMAHRPTICLFKTMRRLEHPQISGGYSLRHCASLGNRTLSIAVVCVTSRGIPSRRKKKTFPFAPRKDSTRCARELPAPHRCAALPAPRRCAHNTFHCALLFTCLL